MFVVGSLVGAVAIAAAALWSADRSENVSAPKWVAAAAQTNVRYSSSPLKLVYAREDALGWGIVMKGDDVPCRGLGRECHYVAFRLRPPSAKASDSGSCETLSPCEAHVAPAGSTALISSCGHVLMADWSEDGRVDDAFPHRCYQEVGAAPLSAKSCAQAIIRDWYPDGWIGRLYPLACYAAAINLVRADMDYSSPRDDFQTALDLARSGSLVTRHHKPQAAFDIRPGMSRADVEALAGRPFKRGPVCWIYHARRAVQPNATGVRVCFADGVVASTQTSVHA